MSTIRFNKFVLIPIIAALMIMTASCIAYRPQVVEVPLIDEKGELQVNGSVGLSAPFGDAYLGTTVTYGATDWLAVQAHGNWNVSLGGYGQLSAGAFKTWDKAVLEGYIGYGVGGNKWNSSKSDRHVKAMYHLPYGQVDFGWKGLANGRIDVGLALKGGMIMPTVNDRQWNETTNTYETKTTKDPVGLLEPQIFFRAGGKHLKWTMNIGYCQLWGTNGNQPFGDAAVMYMPFTINMGLSYDFNVFKKKDK